MSEKKTGENTDKLLEAEMIKEAEMIEKSLVGNSKNNISISDEEVEKSYQQFLKRLETEGMLDENTDSKTAEIVKFPGGKLETEAKSMSEANLLAEEEGLSEESVSNIITQISETVPSLEECKKPWYRCGAAGIAMLVAVGILAGSMAGQADSTKFVSTVQHIINSDTDMP